MDTGRRSWIVFVALALALPGPARADWPQARRDGRRTAAATGVSDIRTPAVYWRTYLGGRLGASEAVPVTIDGGPALVYVSGGRAHASTRDGQVLWDSGPLELVAISSLADLDGDGALEVVAQSTQRVVALDLATGDVRWREDPGEMGRIGGVRVADVDGDARADIVVQECGCCDINSGETGFAYSFAAGFGAPARLWSLPYVACGGGRSLLVDDLDGDGDADVTVSNDDTIAFVDGATGALVASTPDLGSRMSLSWCESTDLTGDGSTELICALGTPAVTTAGTGHRVIALRYASDPARLEVVWSADIGDVDEPLGLGTTMVADLDGDGTREVFASGETTAGAPVTVVLDGATGLVRATVAGHVVVSPVDVTATDRLLLLRADDELSGWSLAPGADVVERRWRVKHRAPLPTRDWSRANQAMATRIVVADVDGDDDHELLAIETETPWVVRAHEMGTPTAATVADWTGVIGADVLAGWVADDRAMTLSGADGRLVTVMPDLQEGLGSVRSGGYYASGAWLQLAYVPAFSDLENDGDDELVVTDSRRTLLALDPNDAANVAPPRLLWDQPSTTAPSIVDGLGVGGGPGVACRFTDINPANPQEMVSAMGAAGEVRWREPLGPTAFNDVLTGDLDGDAVPDIVAQWGVPSDLDVRTTAFAGTDGHVLWTTVTPNGPSGIPAGAALYDWNDDGRDDVVFHLYGTRVLSGVDGAEIAFGGPVSSPYFMPTLVDVTGDSRPEVSLHGGFTSARTLTSDLTADVWVSSENERPFPYAAVTTCPQGPVLIGASLVEPSRVKVTLQASSPGAWQSVVLAGGAIYPDEAAAVAAGATTGQLTSVSVHQDLTGLGRPSAVVGSSDGWLYAVDPCALTLDFSLAFGVPVGAVAFGDADGDDIDELVVSTADGYLHGVAHAPIAAPEDVRDIDVAGAPDVDVDDLATTTTLSATWSAVEGAIGYEVTVAEVDGAVLTDPRWQRVNSNFVTFGDLPLIDGARYTVAVRALSDDGPSPDALSDGVRVHLPGGPDAGPAPDAGDPGVDTPDGGCCDTGGRSAPIGAIVLALGVAVSLRRRRRAP